MRKEAVDSTPSFFDHLRRRLGNQHGADKPGLEQPKATETWFGDSCKPCGERAYDIAEDLEAGIACELTCDFQHPVRRSNKLWKFQVRRSEDRVHFRLYAECGEFLMYARVFKEKRCIAFYTYDPEDCHQARLFDIDRPSFTLCYDQTGSDWRLLEERCMHCQYAPASRRCACRGKREVAHIQQYQQAIGDGIVHCMEITTSPVREDGCGPAPPPCLSSQPLEPMRLTTRAPKWNEDVDCLVMDFKGRHALSSAKNFQLSLTDRPEHVVCQYAKIGSNCFGLDFVHPLSAIQAFGISLSTLQWM